MKNIQRLGDQEDIMWAEEHVRQRIGSEGRVVYGAIRPSEQQVHAISNQSYALFAIPCFWIHAIILLPYFCYNSTWSRKYYSHLLTIITDKEIIVVSKDFSPPCGCCCSTGIDSKIIPIAQISTMNVDTKGRGCNGCQYSHLVVSSNGLRSINLIVPDPTQVLLIINNIRDNLGVHSNANTMMAMMGSAAQGPTSKRIFVALVDDASNFRIINLNGGETLLELCQQVAVKCNLEGTPKFKFKLVDGNITLDNPNDLQNNDRILAIPL